MSDVLLEVEDYRGGFCRTRPATSCRCCTASPTRLKTGVMTAVVGETGSGKSLVALSVLGIQPPAFERIAGRILFRGVDLFGLDEKAMRRVRGAEISMVFQDARAALNPVFTVGRQLADVWQLQHGGGRRAAMKQAIEALRARLHSRAGAAGAAVSARVLRRHGAARHDRHGLADLPARRC